LALRTQALEKFLVYHSEVISLGEEKALAARIASNSAA
jgi:hypothetical protein